MEPVEYSRSAKCFFNPKAGVVAVSLQLCSDTAHTMGKFKSAPLSCSMSSTGILRHWFKLAVRHADV